MRGKRSRTAVLLLSAGLFGLAVATTAAAATLSGSVSIPDGFTPPAPDTGAAPFYWEEWNGFLEPSPRRLDPRRDIAVVLVGEGDAPPNHFELSGGSLLPQVLVASPGSDIQITNTDGCAHELYSDDIDGLTALSTAPGNARSFEAPALGHYRIRDRLYAHVDGYLHVITGLVARAEPDASGRFTFDDVEPGTYTVKVFYKEREVASSEVEVGTTAITIDPMALQLAAEEAEE
ncbi:MAG: carboxypeptidase-like regulatory domain-containing protein [Gemmatimonadota bacterium]|jgi:hypothetical protein